MLLKISGYSISKRPWATLENELYFRGIMLAVREWAHVAAGNGLWEMPQCIGEMGGGGHQEEKVRLWFKCHNSSSAEVKVGTLCGPVAFLLSFLERTGQKVYVDVRSWPGRTRPTEWLAFKFAQEIPLNKAKIAHKTAAKQRQMNSLRWMDGFTKALPSIFGRNHSTIKELVFSSSRLKWKYLWLNTS